uniref:Voltage-dependent T-type calcium channel subunit alpha-1G n=1 Tax=Phallusia mammillata TaxID=59560 RepID=A0A6F9D8D7_9ASCI|nr:voltage-dependent T-type calcium channel subunit alpha-1G [Phallusia mammillata]
MLGNAGSDAIDIPTVKNSFRLTLPRVSPSFNTSALSLPGSLTSDTRHSATPNRRRSGDVTITSAGAIYFSPPQETPCKEPGKVGGYLCSPGLDRNRSPRGSFYLQSEAGSPSKRQTFVRSDVNCSCSAYDITDAGLEPEAEKVVYDDTIASKQCCCQIDCKSKWKKFREFCSEISGNVKRVVDSRYFNRGIMIAILINTMSMGIEHHNQPQTLTEVLEISNVVFTTLFVLEMIAKLVAFGVVGYAKNLYNMFDAVIVIISVWEIVAGTQNGGGLSVLRTFRLLRVLKLVRFLPALRRQLVVLMRTMDNVATFMMLLTLFIFIFSILGMHLFGCEFCKLNQYGETECDRKNFDSLLWAFVTVFQILTQEDWNVVLYNGMAATHPAAAIYFITLMTIGNYVLFNLLVAILVEGFQAECYPDRFQGDDVSDDELSEHSVADEYTRKVANALGLRQPLPTSRALQRQNSMHRVEMSSTSSSLYSSDEDICDDVPIVMTSNGKVSCGDSDDDEAFTHDLPIITRTAATPLPTPTPLASHNSLHEKEPGLSFEQCKFLKGAEYGSIISIDRRRSDSSYGHPATLSSDSRKSSTISRLSVSSHIKAFRSKNKELPLDQQSLVSGIADDESDDYCEDEDVYSNSSFIMSAEGDLNREDDEDTSLMERSFDEKSLSIDSLRREKSCEHDHQMENIFCRCCRNFTSCCAVDRLHKFTSDRRTWSLYLLPPESRLRKSLQRTVASKWFDYVILLFIFGNCITIAMERPSLEDDSLERYVIDVCNYVFTVVFTVELLLKVVANGFYFGDSTYLKSGWNVLDFILVVTSLIDVIMTLASSSGSKLFGILRVLRLLRALRPLRVISRAPGLKVVVQTLLSSLKPIGNIVLICCAFFIIFGILGVQVFKGKFYHCEGPNIRYVTNRTQCLDFSDNTWINHRYNFDDLGQALMSLFVLSSKDGWVEIMYHGIDAVGVDQQPVENYNPWMLLYFISFLLIVGFFVLNMFVGVVVENFHRCREQHELEEMKRREEMRQRKEARLLLKQSRQQQRGGKRQNFRRKTLSRARSRMDDLRGFTTRTWNSFTNVLCCKRKHQKDDLQYYERYSRVRRAIHDFCMNKYFEVAVSLIIGVNILTMATEHYEQPKELGLALKYANYAFTAVFVLEAVFKLIALGVCRYFKDKWNQLDMLIVILSIVGIIIEDMSSGGDRSLFINPTIIRVMRVLRIARVLKLLKISKGIRSLLETVACALPQVGNLGMLFVLLFFIFAALGVELFGTLTCDAEHPCDGLNRHASFHNFGIALLTLFRISTGDNWNGIMKDVMKRQKIYSNDDTLRDTCDASAECRENCCVSTIISPVYFVLFVMMAQFVLVNVVVAVLMKQLEDNRLESSNGEEDNDDVFKDDDDDVAFDEDDVSEEEAPVDSISSSSDKLYDEPDERDSLMGRYTESVTMQELQRADVTMQDTEPRKSSESLSKGNGDTKSIKSLRTNSLLSCKSIEQLKVVNDSALTNVDFPQRIVSTRRSTSPNIPASTSFNPIPPVQTLQIPAKPRLTASLSLPLPVSATPSSGNKFPRRSLNNNHQVPPERRLSDYCTTCECCQKTSNESLPVRSASTNIPPETEEGTKEHLLTVPRNHVSSGQNKSFPQISGANPVANLLQSSRSSQIPTNDVWLSFDDDRPD